MAERARVHLLVSGLVQGVAFRAYTVDEARRLGVSGWVRNLADGRVEAEAEGERRALDALVAFCRRGPPAAQVDDVQATWSAFRGDLGPFATRR
ncbi:MAG TPA: acylphosphatase [Anaeromyxobacter sp.]